MGLQLSFPEEKPVTLWKENLKAFEVFNLSQTQWRHSFNGITGLNYPGVKVIINALGYKKKLILSVQHIEIGYLKEKNRGR